MKYERTLQLTELLQEIQRLSRLLQPLIEEGRDEFDRFSEQLDSVLSNVFPTYTVAFAGPVNSGKSTLLSSLLREGGESPIASIGPSNETFAPMVISYGKSASLLVYYFSVEILERISQHLESLEQRGGPKHEIALYKHLRNTLKGIEAVIASDVDGGIIRKIDLSRKKRQEVINLVRDHIAQSSKRSDVYGVYKVDLAYPGKILQDLNHARFVDLFGFGEPNPLVNMKYTRFISEETIDAVVYTFPDRAVTADFNRLFEIGSFLEEIVANRRLFLVLNKADAYPDISPSQWNQVAREFRSTLVKHVPVLNKHASNLPIFVLSAASIDGPISHRNAEAIRDASLASLHALRDSLRSLSKHLAETSSDPSIYLNTIFDLLGILDLLAQGAEKQLAQLQHRLPVIAGLVDTISANKDAFEERRSGIMESFRASLQSELEYHLKAIDYDRLVSPHVGGLDTGNPQALFRWMLDTSQKGVSRVYSDALVEIFKAVGRFIDQQLVAAYREYVSLQDDSVQNGFAQLSVKPATQPRPLSTTVEYSARELLRFSQTTSLHLAARSLLDRFASWFLRTQCTLDAQRGQQIGQLKAQVVDAVKATVETFMKVYICEEPKLSSSFASSVCTGGEPTYWQQAKCHVTKLDEVLANQVQITKWRLGLYQNKVFFVSHRDEFDRYVKELLVKKDATQALVVELA